MRRLLAIIGLVAGISPLVAENTRPADTPPLVQVGQGPDDSGLPNSGEYYCGPTSMTMNLFWLAGQGFSTVAPEFTEENAYNLDRILGGLSNTDPYAVGTGLDGLIHGVELYLSLKGLAGSVHAQVINAPSPEDLASHFTGYNMLTTSIGWYTRQGDTNEYQRTAGHFVALLDYDGDTNTATINNPEPHSLYDVPNVPDEVRQQPSVAMVDPALNLGMSGTYYQYVTSVYPGGTAPARMAVIAHLLVFEVSATPGAAPAVFTATSTLRINTNGGSFSAEAPLAGSGGIEKTGDGALTLTGSNALTGTHLVLGGTLASTLTTDGSGTATPFGTGSVVVSNGGVLRIAPAEVSSPGPKDVTVSVASGSGSPFRLGGGAAGLELEAGDNDSLTVYLGGETDGVTPNVLRENYATLALEVGSGLTDLGGRVRVFVNGTGDNLPQTNHGIVSPAMIGVDTDGSASGAFLGYEVDSGFVVASVTSGSSFSGANNQTVFATSMAIDLGSDAVTVAALQANHDITGTAHSVLSILPEGAQDAGLILNNATIATGTLSFGDRDAFVYAASGTSRIEAVLDGTGGLTTFGSGELVLSGTAASFTGGIFVNAGTLTVQNAATGTAAITVRSGATLGISGSNSVVEGAVQVAEGASLAFDDHGVLRGELTLPQGATLYGTGTVEFASTLMIQGTIGDGIHGGLLTFASTGTDAVVLDGTAAIFNWTLTEATDDESAFGVAWMGVVFDANATVGSGSAPLGISLGFAEGLLPDQGNDFWNDPHTWKLFEFNEEYSFDGKILNNLYRFTVGTFSLNPLGTTVWLVYTPVPEPSAALLLTGAAAAGLLGRRTRRSHR
jgi:autotransporter-associated beta strand protein